MIKQLSLFNEPIAPLHDQGGDYFFLISPSEEVKRNIKRLKEKLETRIDMTRENIKSAPHISLFKCPAGSNTDDNVIRFAEQKLKTTRQFSIRLNGLDAFFHGTKIMSLILKVGNPEPIRAIYQLLLSESRFSLRKYTPHLTLAKSISINEFNKISSNLSEFEYATEFVCEKITILKRTTEGGQKTRYQILREVDLINE